MQSGDMEFFYQSSTRHLSGERSDFPHLASHGKTLIVKIANFEKKIENEMK